MAKTQWHLKANTRELFSDFIVDYFEAVCSIFNNPKGIVHLMDAIVGMEANGPGTAGKPREIGAVIVSEDAVAADFIAANLVGFNPKLIKTISIAAGRGLGKKGFNEIEFDQHVFNKLRLDKFESAPLPFQVKLEKIPWLNNLIKRLTVERPVPIEGKCTLCYQCRQICSAKAIDKGDTVAQFNYDKCIRCFCCIEICPEAAIMIKGNLLSRIFSPNKG
jgi:ferredoxin